MTLPIPAQVVYAGLVGLFFALVIATAQQKWKPKVFFLLALRLAIGWQFFFEGMHKIHSHAVGVTETSRMSTPGDANARPKRGGAGLNLHAHSCHGPASDTVPSVLPECDA